MQRMFQNRGEKGNQKERNCGKCAQYNRRNISKVKELIFLNWLYYKSDPASQPANQPTSQPASQDDDMD